MSAETDLPANGQGTAGYTDVVRMVQLTSAAEKRLAKLLKEVDRRALNALILVKRHGKVLSGYGVITNAFRAQVHGLKRAMDLMHQSLDPLVQRKSQEMLLIETQELFERASGLSARPHARLGAALQEAIGKIRENRRGADHLAQVTLLSINDLKALVARMEYTITQARIEAALANVADVPLTQISDEMGHAVVRLNEEIDRFSSDMERIHEVADGF